MPDFPAPDTIAAHRYRSRLTGDPSVALLFLDRNLLLATVQLPLQWLLLAGSLVLYGLPEAPQEILVLMLTALLFWFAKVVDTLVERCCDLHGGGWDHRIDAIKRLSDLCCRLLQLGCLMAAMVYMVGREPNWTTVGLVMLYFLGIPAAAAVFRVGRGKR